MNTLGHLLVGLTRIRKHRQILKGRMHVTTLASDLLIPGQDGQNPLHRASLDHIHSCGLEYAALVSRLCKKSPGHSINMCGLNVWRIPCLTIESMTTHGKFKEDTISKAKDVLPEPELPATPMMLVSVHGGKYWA